MTKEVSNKNDLRVVKTRENIESTFLELLGERDFSQITVTDIVTTCRISKGTFYYHYRDKYDLADKLLRRQFAQYDELFARVQQEGEGGSDLSSLTGMAVHIASAFEKLGTIHTRELDAKEELTRFLQERFLDRMERGEAPTTRNSFQVSRMLAAIIVAEVEMIIAGEAEPGEQFIETMNDLESCLKAFRLDEGKE